MLIRNFSFTLRSFRTFLPMLCDNSSSIHIHENMTQQNIQIYDVCLPIFRLSQIYGVCPFAISKSKYSIRTADLIISCVITFCYTTIEWITLTSRKVSSKTLLYYIIDALQAYENCVNSLVIMTLGIIYRKRVSWKIHT